jgi:flagellar biosynthesis/type III secretory pathway chaperone
VNRSAQAKPMIETDQLADLIREKLAILLQMRELARRQMDLIGESRMPKLMSVLAAKQTMLSELRKLEQRLDPFRNQAPESRYWRCPEDRQRCRQMASDSETILQEILHIEKEAESKLAERRDHAGARLQSVQTSAQATQAYTQAPRSTAHSFDLTSDT